MRRRRSLTDETVGAWRRTLVAGLVVDVAVWALLEGLRRTVNDVDEAVTDVWTAGKRLAQNTQAAHLLTTTRDRGADLLEEIERHRPEEASP